MTLEEEVEMLEAENQRMFEFVRYIARNYVESWPEKVRIQRDEYVRMANNLLELLS